MTTKPRKRKPPFTPRSQIKAALHKLWLESRERREALYRTSYCCAKCRRKASKAKGREFAVSVHHLDGIDWIALVDLVRERLLPSPDRLMPLCHEDHEIADAERREKAAIEKHLVAKFSEISQRLRDNAIINGTAGFIDPPEFATGRPRESREAIPGPTRSGAGAGSGRTEAGSPPEARRSRRTRGRARSARQVSAGPRSDRPRTKPGRWSDRSSR
jgi:hypothetical protein